MELEHWPIFVYPKTGFGSDGDRLELDCGLIGDKLITSKRVFGLA
jgi:hypothetical protein